MSRLRKSEHYIDGKMGWKIFTLSIIVAVLAGLGLRLVFNPDRIKAWADLILSEQGARAGIKFQTVSLDLARNSFPQLALELTGIAASPAEECRNEPSVKIDKLRVPLDFFSLLSGRLAIGTILAENVVVDLDGVKARCPPAPGAGRPSHAESRIEHEGSGEVERKLASEPATPWWRTEQLVELRKRLRGLRANHVELQFENKAKKVYLDNVSVRLLAGGDSQKDAIDLSTDLRIPPELSYDETLPLIHIEGEAHSTNADVTVRAGLSEGNLQAKANLRPAADGLLDIDLRASIETVPLSTMIPVVTKSGLVKGAFKPHFLWMDCQASINGKFQGLFNDNALTLENCQVVGENSKIHVTQAVRDPDGSWRPFSLEFENVDVGRMLETFDVKTLDGVVADYGRLSGKAEIVSRDHVHAQGTVSDLQIKFSNRGEVALQPVKSARFLLDSVRGDVEGRFDHIELQDGEFDGYVEYQLDSRSRLGTVRAAAKQIKFQEGIAKLLFAGTVGGIDADLRASFEGGAMKSGVMSLQLDALSGKDFDLKKAAIRTEYRPEKDDFSLDVRATDLTVAQSSWFIQEIRPLFFDHHFSQAPIQIHDTIVHGRILKPSGFEIELLKSSLESGKIRFTSGGSLSRDRRFDGWVGLDFPSEKHLKWKVSGLLGDRLEILDDSKALADLRKHGVVDDKRLGLPVLQLGSARSFTEKTGRGLRELGEKVIQKARDMIPSSAAAGHETVSESANAQLPAKPLVPDDSNQSEPLQEPEKNIEKPTSVPAPADSPG